MCHLIRYQYIKVLMVTLLLVCCSSFAAQDRENKTEDEFADWGKAGYNADQYETGFLEKLKDSGRQLGFIKALNPSKRGFGTLMRTAGIQEYRGKRLQLTAYIKTVEAQSAAAWFRVNGQSKTLVFDNMEGRKIKGTHDWQQVTLVLDIPEEAESVSYGIMLEGKGKLWFDQPTFKVVDLTVHTTERQKQALRPLYLGETGLQRSMNTRDTSNQTPNPAIKSN